MSRVTPADESPAVCSLRECLGVGHVCGAQVLAHPHGWLTTGSEGTNELAHDGKVRNWREAFESGTVKASGPPEILKLIQNVVEKQGERSRTRKLRTR